MATSIQLLRSNIAQLRPDPATLAEGMPMVNLHEGEPGMFFRLRDGSLVKIGPAFIGPQAPNIAAQGYTGNTVGEQWVDVSDPAIPVMKMWDGTQWIIISGGTGEKGDPGADGKDGDKGDQGQKGEKGLDGIGEKGEKGDFLKGDQGDSIKGQKGGQSELLEFKGVVNQPGDLPDTGVAIGDAYLVLSSNTYHAWEGTSWYDIGDITAGDDGSKGEEGQKGAPGLDAVGQKGKQGDTGLKGFAGVKGQQGLKGDQGIKGDIGPQNDKGEKGEAIKGDIGDKGIKGDGAQALPALYFRGNTQDTSQLPGGANIGDTYYVVDDDTYYTFDGAQWWDIGDITKGEKGEKGLDGDGTKGEKGEPLEFDDMTAAEKLSLKGQKGKKGQKGEKGQKGQKGFKGEKGQKGQKGKKGQKGEKGKKGEKGFKGEKGQKGSTGNKGQKGEEGPVAGAQGEIIFNLDGIDPGSSPNLTWDNATNTFATANMVITGDSEFRNSPNQDGIKLIGRPGGTGDFDVTFTPDPLSADRTIVLPDEDGVLVTTGSQDVVTSVMIVDNEILNQDINADANIEVSKLQDIPSGNFIVGDATNQPSIVPMSGDATLSGTGQVDIVNDVNLGGDPTTTTQVSTDDSDKIATTAFVQLRIDETIQGIDSKQEVAAATVGANITLATTQTIDGVSLAVGDRVLVKDQTNPNDNGIYIVDSGAWSRAPDANTFSELVGAFVFSTGGIVNSDSGFISQAEPGGTIGSDPVPFSQFSGAGQIIAGGGMTKNGNQLDVNTADPTRIVVNGDDIDLAVTPIAAGTYRSITVDTYGRAVAATNPTTYAGYGLSDTSANFGATLTDETGTGSVVFSISPNLTGDPTAPTQLSGDNSNKLATTGYVDSALSANPLGNGLIFIGNTAGVAVGTAMNGDATINNAGVVTIQPSVIDSNNIIDGTIVTADLANNSVTNGKIVDGSVTETKIGLGAVTSAKILDGTIITADLADNAVQTAKIADLAVTETKLANDSVTSAKIVNGTIVTVDLADDAISEEKLLDGAVATAKILDQAVTSAKIADGTIVTSDLADSAVTSAKILDATIQQADLADNIISSDKIVNGTILTVDLADNIINTDKIVDGTILNVDLANATIEGGKLVNSIALSGTPTTTTQVQGDNSTAIATTAYVDAAAASIPVSPWQFSANGQVEPLIPNRDVVPQSDNTVSLGQPALRWANVFTADMHFSNEGMSNDTDGTWGSWTLQEGENNIFFTNNRTGKTFKMVMEPVN